MIPLSNPRLVMALNGVVETKGARIGVIVLNTLANKVVWQLMFI